LVAATPISGPAWVYRTPWDSRAIDELTALVTARVAAALPFAARRAARVSAVSPDWDMTMTRASFSRMKSR